MNKEKLVVVLLLITIILSVISLIVTFSANTTGTPVSETKIPDESSAAVSFGIAPSASGGTE